MLEIVATGISALYAGLPLWVWLGFLLLVVAVLVVDLGLFNKEAHEPSFRGSALLAGLCLSLGFAFSGVVYWIYSSGLATSLDPSIANAGSDAARGAHAAQLYLTGWIVEQSLAFDNIFVMSLVFGYFAIPPKYQHRVLFYGILGVVVLRALLIGAGAALVHEFEWVLYLFAAFLIITGLKMLLMADEKPDIAANPVLKWMRRHMAISNDIDGSRFFVMRAHEKTGKVVRHATPLFVALVMIEFVDLVFAVDSVPAVLAITRDPFIVYTSNIFAILGLRALYVVLSAFVNRFHYLKYALALVLVVIGAKIVAQPFVGKIPPELSLLATAGLIAGGVIASLIFTRAENRA